MRNQAFHVDARDRAPVNSTLCLLRKNREDRENNNKKLEINKGSSHLCPGLDGDNWSKQSRKIKLIVFNIVFLR